MAAPIQASLSTGLVAAEIFAAEVEKVGPLSVSSLQHPAVAAQLSLAGFAVEPSTALVKVVVCPTKAAFVAQATGLFETV